MFEIDERMMRCPWCFGVFWIKEEEQYNSETFECPHCFFRNDGCVAEDEYGVLVGVKP